MNEIKYKESDLFEPIKKYFLDDGFIGDGELGKIDLYLEKDGLSIAVELKKNLDLKAIEQAALDQKTCDLVYIGIFKPNDIYSRANKDKIYLLKRLGIGLILVSKKTEIVEIFLDPIVSELSNFQKKHKDKALKLKKEFKERKLKDNIGGVNKTKLMTSYKEKALIVLYYLNELGGKASPKEINILNKENKTSSILYNNYYGWFLHIDKGQYAISNNGKEALVEYGDIIQKLV